MSKVARQHAVPSQQLFGRRHAQPMVIALLAVPMLIQVYFNSGLAYFLNRITGEQHCVAA